jgi:AraC family transcriptional regulator, L-rhamnose operon transcriptional activator RhaR
MSLHPAAFSECRTHLDALAALRHQPVALHRADIVGRLSLLFGQLGQAAAQAGGTLPEAPGPAHPSIVRAMRMLEADVARPWTLTGFAAELHLTPGYLVRLFKAATGLPPMAYLAQLRAEHAAVLLLHSDAPITQIGRAVGWPDQSNFARRFKAHYGLSATTYRKRFATRAADLHHPAVTVN